MNRSSIKKGTSKASAFFVGLGTLITGTINAVIIKEQDIIKNDKDRAFFHPFLQTFFMFFAEFIILLLFFSLMSFSINFKNEYVIRREEARRLGMNINSSNLLPLLPALVDLVGSILHFVSIFLMDPSIYIMLRGGVPITTAILSVLFLKAKLYSHHKFGLISIFLGLVFLCMSSAMTAKEHQAISIIFALSSLVTTGIQFVIEEKILTQSFLHPLKLVGLEGLWGILLSSIVLLVMSFIKCHSESEFCNGGHLEDIPATFKQVFGNSSLLLAVIIAIVNSSFFNFFGISVAKYVSPIVRTSISVIVSILVWIYSFIRFNNDFSVLQLAGFILVVFGNLVNQEILEIPGLNSNTRKNQEKRALFNESLAVEDDEDE